MVKVSIGLLIFVAMMVSLALLVVLLVWAGITDLGRRK